jgi:UDP-3-O-[3-hydroxymyristoyl] N-acetylglucosamine deacetylase/3-hydroxyacyl-[acyl-carrier-protein] dehydratase
MENLKLLLERYDKCKPNGILDNLTLHYPNEAARTQLLMLWPGDLALVELKYKVKLLLISQPGHFVNTQFAKNG